MPPLVDIVEEVKEKNPIEQVVEETEPLTGTGRYRKGRQHDSLVVDTKGQAYFWNSMGEDDQGDVITWVVKHRQCADFKDAIEWLCRRANLPTPEWGGQNAQARLAARAREDVLTVAARWFVRRLRESTEAQEYARGRGWTDETIRESGIGFTGRGTEAELKDLRGDLSMNGVELDSPQAVAILGWRGDVKAWGEARWGLVYSYEGMRSVMKRNRLGLKVPRPQSEKADVQAQETWQKKAYRPS